MKAHLYQVIALAFLSAVSVHAAGSKVEILGDKQLGSIEGGYCLFWRCEGTPGTANCQPVKDDTIDLCKTVTCKLVIDMEGNTEVLQCELNGETETCSEASTYVQCIRSRQPTLCIRSSQEQTCGDLVMTYCFPDIKHRQCFCDSGTDGTPCDWTSCVN
jgi:hypothetical protein